MGDIMITSDFSRHEMWCRCPCQRGVPSERLMRYLQTIRVLVDRPITIHRGGSCPQHNAAVGGETTSYHVNVAGAFEAVDYSFPGYDPLGHLRAVEGWGLDVGGQGAYYAVLHNGFQFVDLVPELVHYDVGRSKRGDGGPRKWVAFSALIGEGPEQQRRYCYLDYNFCSLSHAAMVGMAMDYLKELQAQCKQTG